jgi:hypothetical protein
MIAQKHMANETIAAPSGGPGPEEGLCESAFVE